MSKVFFARIAGLLLLGLTLVATAKDSSPTERVYTTLWQISLDAEGRVVELVPNFELTPGITEALKQAISTWQFEPGAVNGKPQPTQSWLSVRVGFGISARKIVSLRILDVDAGGHMEFDRSNIPKYPSSMLRRREQGMAVVKVEYDGDGKITQAALAEYAPAIHPTLAGAAIDAVLRWKVTPERVAGHGVAGAMIVPFCFTLGDSKPGWCKFTPPDRAGSAETDRPINLAAVTKLKTSVVGQVL
ncbi:MAG: TonB family protein [Lysobacterales bacterium]